MTDVDGYIQAACGGTQYNRRLSSALWGTRFTAPTTKGEPTGNTADWDAARQAFREAMTLANPQEREAALARTFLYLGYVMHLIQDLAVPSHARDDFRAHVEFNPTGMWPNQWINEAFEGFLKRRRDLVLGTGTVAVPLVGNDSVTRFWDTGQYRQSGTPSADLTQGLAEYTSANFVSKHTRFQGPFPHPTEASTNLSDFFAGQVPPRQVTAEDGIVDTVLYVRKRGAGDPGGPGAGDAIDPFLKAGYFTNTANARPDYGIPIPLTFQLDDEVMAAHAAKLLPRAVGYSAGLLDYFFRGRIAIAAPDRFVYARAPFTADNSGAFTSLRFKVKNVTPNEAAGAGTLQAVVRYRTAEGNLFVNPLGPLSATPVVVLSAVQDVILTDTFQELTFDFQAHPIPTNAADLFLTVVYQGPLGSEPDAVAVGGKNIQEPDPVVIVEATDYDCYQGQPYLVAGLPVSARDLNGDGAQDLFGPYREQGLRVKLDPAGTWQSPTADRFDLTVSELMGGQYAGFVVLQDQYSYQVAWQSIFQDTSTGQSEPYTRWYDLAAIYNSVSTDPDGTVRRQVTYANPAHFRGLTVLHGVATTTFATSHACFQQMFMLPPAVTEVPATLSTQ